MIVALGTAEKISYLSRSLLNQFDRSICSSYSLLNMPNTIQCSTNIQAAGCIHQRCKVKWNFHDRIIMELLVSTADNLWYAGPRLRVPSSWDDRDMDTDDFHVETILDMVLDAPLAEFFLFGLCPARKWSEGLVLKKPALHHEAYEWIGVVTVQEHALRDLRAKPL